MKIKRALISVSNKKGIIEFAKSLTELNIEIISTGGTAKKLYTAKIPVIHISDYTGFPEILGGRVKTLHPFVHGGILALRNNKMHTKEVKTYSLKLIDMVVVNLYPFQETVTNPKVTQNIAMDNIDIGGVALIRSAAKNYESVAVIVNPDRYKEIIKELQENNGELSYCTKLNLAIEAFNLTHEYDNAIYEYLKKRNK
ncbi:MAG: hypothetical protein ACE5J3_07090 [Methanosarcinales archaeon]